MRPDRLVLPLVVLLLSACVSAPRRSPEPPRPERKPTAAPDVAPSPPAPERRRPLSRRQIESMPFPKVLPIPVDGVDRAELSSTFGAPRSGGRRHEGIDIFAPRDTPVRATVPGWVSYRGLRSLGGRTISVIGPRGHRHYYAHLEAWAGFAQGDLVAPGDVLGYVGNSGNAKAGPPHLHYAIYRNGKQPLDPFPLLRDGPGSFE